MKAMILAAGLGTRLRPLTDDRPKALVNVGGKPLLQIVLERIITFGFHEIIINAHHKADMIADFVRQCHFEQVRIEVSPEPTLLDTGGGLKNAGWFFDDGRPFLLHNSDVLTDLNYNALMKMHVDAKNRATLAVRQRKASRYLLFDNEGQLKGWKSENDGRKQLIKSAPPGLQSFSFMGVHAIDPQIFAHLPDQPVFSIIDAYLKLAAEGHRIGAFKGDDYRWMDVGRKENLEEAARFLSLIS